jgi:hypothetical protein
MNSIGYPGACSPTFHSVRRKTRSGTIRDSRLHNFGDDGIDLWPYRLLMQVYLAAAGIAR